MTLSQAEIDEQIAELFQREKEGVVDSQQVIQRIKILTNVLSLRQARRDFFCWWIKASLLSVPVWLLIWYLRGFKWDGLIILCILFELLYGLFLICQFTYQVKQAEKLL